MEEAILAAAFSGPSPAMSMLGFAHLVHSMQRDEKRTRADRYVPCFQQLCCLWDSRSIRCASQLLTIAHFHGLALYCERAV